MTTIEELYNLASENSTSVRPETVKDLVCIYLFTMRQIASSGGYELLFCDLPPLNDNETQGEIEAAKIVLKGEPHYINVKQDRFSWDSPRDEITKPTKEWSPRDYYFQIYG